MTSQGNQHMKKKIIKIMLAVLFLQYLVYA